MKISLGKRGKIVFGKDGSLTITNSMGHVIKFDAQGRIVR